MSGHETKGRIEPGAAPFEGEEQHGWAPDAGKQGTEEGHEASKKAFQSNEETGAENTAR
jgi:hypothetical protein